MFTQPDRPAGRGQALHASPVKRRALELGLPVHQPATFKSPEASQLLQSLELDALVVVAYGLILPPAALGCPGWAASTSMPRCCRAGAARRRFSVRCSQGTRAPASPSCAWRLASIRVRCLRRGKSTSARATLRRPCMMGSRNSGRSSSWKPSTRFARAASHEIAAARRWRHLRGKNQQARGADRLAARMRCKHLAAGSGLQSLAGCGNPLPRGAAANLGSRTARFNATQCRRCVRERAGHWCLPRRRMASTWPADTGTLRVTRLQLAGRNPLPAREFIKGQRLVRRNASSLHDRGRRQLHAPCPHTLWRECCARASLSMRP